MQELRSKSKNHHQYRVVSSEGLVKPAREQGEINPVKGMILCLFDVIDSEVRKWKNKQVH